MGIQQFSKRQPSGILKYSNYLTVGTVQRVNMCHHEKFGGIGQTVCEITGFFLFVSKWRLSALLNLLCACLTNPRIAFGGVYDLSLCKIWLESK